MLKAVPHIVNRAGKGIRRAGCKEIEKTIPAFMAGDLDCEELSAFLAHVEHCSSCREELTIQFLVERGMKRLEEGDTFHLARELDTVLSARKRELVNYRRIRLTAYAFETAAFILAGVCAVMAVLILR